MRSQITRPRVTFKVLHTSCSATQKSQLSTRLVILHNLVSASAKVLADPESSCVSSGSAGGKNVICADALITIGNASTTAKEKGAVVLHLDEGLAGVFGQDLDVFACVDVCKSVGAFEIFDHDDLSKLAP